MKTVLILVTVLSLVAAPLAAGAAKDLAVGALCVTSAIISGSVVAILDRLDAIRAELAKANTLKGTANTALPPVLS